MGVDAQLAEFLLELMEKLEEIGHEHGELYDTDVREQMHESILNGFIRPVEDYEVPDEFGMFSDEGNTRVRDVLEEYIMAAMQRTSMTGMSDPNARLEAFQNPEVHTEGEERCAEEFFGWVENVEA